MADEVKVPAPANLAEAVRDQVREVLFKSIPNEQLDKLILSEYNKFFEDSITGGQWDKRIVLSPFKQMVAKEIENYISENLKTAVKGRLNKLRIEWDGEGDKVIGDLVDKMAPTFIASMTKHYTGQILQSLRNNGGL